MQGLGLRCNTSVHLLTIMKLPLGGCVSLAAVAAPLLLLLLSAVTIVGQVVYKRFENLRTQL